MRRGRVLKCAEDKCGGSRARKQNAQIASYANVTATSGGGRGPPRDAAGCDTIAFYYSLSLSGRLASGRYRGARDQCGRQESPLRDWGKKRNKDCAIKEVAGSLIIIKKGK